MNIRKGKTKSILNASIDSALLAVEIYNKPRTTFRSQAFISLMIMAWTRLFHAFFNLKIGDKYYYKNKNGRFEKIDGERKAWELKTCIKNYGKLSQAETANLEFFIRLRNKIEHRNIEKREIDALIFGECQSLLFNYESYLTNMFGIHYALNENLVYSLQFSTMRIPEQNVASKRILAAEVEDIRKYIETYRSSLPDETFNSQSYSIKLIQIPKISNTNKHDLAIEFVKWDELSDNDKEAYQKVTAIVKEKIVKQEAVNVKKLKPGQVLLRVKELTGRELSHYDHKCLFVIFNIRPDTSNVNDPFDTNSTYCLYDEVHDDYVYTEEWVECLSKIIKANKMLDYMWANAYKQNRRYKIEQYI